MLSPGKWSAYVAVKSSLLLALIVGAAPSVSVPVMAAALARPGTNVLERFGSPAMAAAAQEPFGVGGFRLAPGETIVVVGQANMVRHQKSGDLEATLAIRFAEQRPRFRFMAWEGDTVYEQWRDLNFGPWPEQLTWAGASVVMAQFGQMESLDGVGRLAEFVAAYEKLLDQFGKRTRRIVLLSPTPFETPPSPEIPDLTRHNPALRAYAAAIRSLAERRGAVFVDLSSQGQLRLDRHRWTENGIHLTPEGMRAVAVAVTQQLGGTGGIKLPGEQLRERVREKNRLWFDCWRPMNWAFAYGDRTHVEFSQPDSNRPWLMQELEAFKPLIARADEQIHALAAGTVPPGDLPLTAPPVPPNPEPPLTPEQELATFTPREGFSVNLFASERDGLVKPIQVAWDARGRLWAACSPTYPHIDPGAKPADYILVCEDTNGDGKADQFHRFAEGLFMVQGVEVGDGGVYLCESTELVHLKDTDGDGKADQRRVILSGFGTGDTHQLINSVGFALDGSLWFTQGLHIFSRVETPWGISRLDKSGVWRLRPRTLRLDPFFNNATAGHNCWGVVHDDFGQVFHKSGDRPDGYYTVPGMIRVANPSEYHPKGSILQTKAKTTAIDILGTAGLPKDLDGSVITAGFMAADIEAHRLLDDGSGFRTEQQPKLLRSSTAHFRPVDVSAGPDGAVYVADFYNPIIGHYQHSYRDPRRDKTHGRIWRISANGLKAPPIPALESLAVPELVALLSSPERWVRGQAQRLLFMKPSGAVVSGVLRWIERQDPATPEYGRSLVDAAGMLEAHETMDDRLLRRLVESRDPRVRAYGVRWAGDHVAELGAGTVLDLLKTAAADDSARVRLESVVAASLVRRADAIEVAASVLERPRDRFIEYALVNTARALRPVWQPALESGAVRFGSNAVQTAFVLDAIGPNPAETPGATVFKFLCLNCHQPDGRGLPSIYPPIAGSERVVGDPGVLIRMVLHGLKGPLVSGGKTYNNLMPPSGLSDRQIADVLTYVRSQFGNKAGPVTVEQVAATRKAHRDRIEPWTLEELLR